MAVNPNTTFTGGQVLTADNANRFPRGVMGFVRKTNGNVTATTTNTDIPGTSITFTAAANRIYVAHYSLFVQKQTAQGFIIIRCTTGANVIYNTTVQTMGVNLYGNLSGTAIFDNLAAGTQTIKLRSEAENNTALIISNANDVITLIVEDLGPA